MTYIGEILSENIKCKTGHETEQRLLSGFAKNVVCPQTEKRNAVSWELEVFRCELAVIIAALIERLLVIV